MVNYPTILNLPQKDINRQLYERVLKLQVKAKYHVLSLTINDGTDPISGATVTIGSDSVTTGADGKCSFELVDGTYDISVTKTGYADGSSSVTISGKKVSKTISLTVVDTINFTINDGANAISGATVVIGETSKTTGTSGGCTFPDMPYDTYSATVSAEGYTSKTESIVFDATHKSFTISLSAAGDTGTVTVTCQDSTQNPLTADIILEEDDGGGKDNIVWGVGVAGEDGTCVLKEPNELGLPTDVTAEIPYGTYILGATYDGGEVFYGYLDEAFVIDGDETVTITLIPIDGGD